MCEKMTSCQGSTWKSVSTSSWLKVIIIVTNKHSKDEYREQNCSLQRRSYFHRIMKTHFVNFKIYEI